MKTEQQRLPRFAVLIDADTTSPQIARGSTPKAKTAEQGTASSSPPGG